MPLPPEAVQETGDDRSLTRVFQEHGECRVRSLIEAAIFASPEPVTTSQLARALQEPENDVRRWIEDIVGEHEKPEHGVFIRKVGGGYQMGTKPEHYESLKEILRRLRPRAPLSLPALQTLAIIAYKQPISAPEILAVRRVEGAGVLQTLLRRKLIAAVGRKNDSGHAVLYKTTGLFLKEFGLQDLKDLPALEDFAELRRHYEETGRTPLPLARAPLKS